MPMILGSIDITDEDGRRLLLERAERHLARAKRYPELPVAVVDIDERDQYPDVKNYIMDFAVISTDTKAILFRSYYNRLPVVTFAGAYLDWIDPDGQHDWIPIVWDEVE